MQVLENKACGQWEFWGLISCTAFKKHSPVVLLQV
jgi:hypothetical protein